MKPKKTVASYKPAEDREKDLKLAFNRIQKSRARTGETKVSIAAVAREAGVSPALIHNHYPKIAEAIRDAQGLSSRATRDSKHQELTAERKKRRRISLRNSGASDETSPTSINQRSVAGRESCAQS